MYEFNILDTSDGPTDIGKNAYHHDCSVSGYILDTKVLLEKKRWKYRGRAGCERLEAFRKAGCRKGWK